MKTSFYCELWRDQFVFLPTIMMEIGHCHCCTNKVLGIAFVWGSVALGVVFEKHP